MSDSSTIQTSSASSTAPVSSATAQMFGGGNFDPQHLDATPLPPEWPSAASPSVAHQESSPVTPQPAVTEESKDIKTPAPREEAPHPASSEIAIFLRLVEQTQALLKLQDQEEFTLIGQKSPDSMVRYVVSLFDEEEEDDTLELFIKKVLQNTHQEEEEHLLQFVYHPSDHSLEILVDEEPLYVLPPQAWETFSDSILVKEKIDKFSLLTSDLLHKVQKEKEEAAKALQKKHQLQEVFRNF